MARMHGAAAAANYPLLIISLGLLLLVVQSAAAAWTSVQMLLKNGGTDHLPFPNGTYLDRSAFPPGFVFGALTLAIKHEGKDNTTVKPDSIWDAYAAKNESVVFDLSTPGSCGGEYSHYKEDVALLEEIGFDAFRFSIAWTRIFPNGIGSTPDANSIDHYNKLINLLIEKGIEPHVTLWVEDHPQALEDAYGGLLSTLFIDDFVAFANVCFSEFGDRVKYWTTFDEPNDYVSLAYASTQSPPGRCSPGYSSYILSGTCSSGNSSTEPYIVAHNILLAHAAAVKLYKNKYQYQQGGEIGIALWFRWYEPLNETYLHAAKRAQDFYFGWFMEPLLYGKYPDTMVNVLGSRLPSFTELEAIDLRNSFDFIGLNAFTASYVLDSGFPNNTGYFFDMDIDITRYKDGVAIGEGDLESSVPWCLPKILSFVKENYENPPVYITEIGWGTAYSDNLQESLNDTERVRFYYSYFEALSEAMRDQDLNVRGVFAWSLVDGFELFLGLVERFGLIYVDQDLNRYPRLSAFWFQQLLSNSGSKYNTQNRALHINQGLEDSLLLQV